METSCSLFVVIPVYNAEKYVAQALDSVLAQPYKNIRIVCVDDGSPDDSIVVLQDYAKEYENIHIIRKENGGVSSARNAGIDYVLAHCSDEDYLIFLDADDLWAKNVISQQAVSQWTDADCVGYASIRCTNDLSMVSPGIKLDPATLPGGKNSIWCHQGHHMGAVFYSCALLRRYSIRFIDGLKYAEDGLFKFACLFLADKIQLINQVLYLYRMNAISAMHSRNYGIEYMAPIIRGYLETGSFLKSYETESRGSARFCDVLAGVYAIELMVEHYQHLRSRSVLEEFLRENPDIADAAAQLQRSDLSENHQQMYDMYTHSPTRFRFRNYLTGIKEYFLQMLSRNSIILHLTEKQRYPNPNPYL